jgi:GNAT superfamily N-acetyltransferase
MLSYQVEALGDIFEEVRPLLDLHWEDVALDQETIKLNPNWTIYAKMADNGTLHITTARDETGELVGYAAYLLSENNHYQQMVQADGDIFWLHPKQRKGMAGVRLLRKAEEFLIECGVKKIINKVKLHKDVGIIFERLGYTAIERVYAKTVG